MTEPRVQDLLAEIDRLRDEVKLLTQRAESAEALAGRDVLTSAMNRRGFMNMVTRVMAFCRRHQVEAVLIYLDLDGFKHINDQLGHAAGDAALMRVVDIINENVRESDGVGRMGGDEFAVLLTYAGLAEGQAKAEKLARLFKSAGFSWQGQGADLRGSFGVRLLEGQKDAETWLAEADAAMWLRKREPR